MYWLKQLGFDLMVHALVVFEFMKLKLQDLDFF